MRQTCVIVLFFLSLFSSVHADETIANGLTLKIPSPGQRNWDVLFRDEFAEPISSHDHTGSGNGVQLGSGSFSNNAVTGAKIRLANNENLRARNAANSADVDLFKLTTTNTFLFAPSAFYYTGDPFLIAADTTNGSDSKTLQLTGGGSMSAGRGASLYLQGEQDGGDAVLSGDGGRVILQTAAGSYGVEINAGGFQGLAILPSSGAVNIPLLTASRPLYLDASKNITSPTTAAFRTNLGVGTGDTPSFTGVNVSGATASLPVFTDSSKNLITPSVATAWSTLNAASTWTDWTPTLSGDGTAILGSTSIARGRYNQVGKTVRFLLEFSGTFSGSNSYWAAFTLPVTAASVDGVVFTGYVGDITGLSVGAINTCSAGLFNTTTAIIRPFGGAQFLTSAYTWTVSGTYEAA